MLPDLSDEGGIVAGFQQHGFWFGELISRQSLRSVLCHVYDYHRVHSKYTEARVLYIA